MIVISQQHNGPPSSAHGGLAAGRFAEFVNPCRASVRFHRPIPMAKALRPHTRHDRASVDVLHGDEIVATVTVTEDAIQPELASMQRVSSSDVAAAERDWAQTMAQIHPFPTCFACGPERAVGSGLGLRPGQVDDSGRYVTTWLPKVDGSVAPWLVWTALDCPSGAPALGAVGADEQVVTGTISVIIDGPAPGDGDYQIISRLTDRQGRKLATEAALIDGEGRVLASCSALWIAVPRLSKEEAA